MCLYLYADEFIFTRRVIFSLNVVSVQLVDVSGILCADL